MTSQKIKDYLTCAAQTRLLWSLPSHPQDEVFGGEMTLLRAKVLARSIQLRQSMTPEEQQEATRLVKFFHKDAQDSFPRCAVREGEFRDYAVTQVQTSTVGPVRHLLHAMAHAFVSARRLLPGSHHPTLEDLLVAQQLVVHPVRWFGAAAELECFDKIPHAERCWDLLRVGSPLPTTPWMDAFKVELDLGPGTRLVLFPTRPPPLCFDPQHASTPLAQLCADADPSPPVKETP